jgi:hypothetical protein
VFYTVDGHSGSRSLVETVFYSGPLATPDPNDTDHGHYWIAGAGGNNGKWVLRLGPSYPDLVWDFFSRHPRSAGATGGRPQITLVGANPVQLTVGQAFIDPGATATDPEDGSLPIFADCSSVDTGRSGRYTCSYRATDSAANTVTATREVVVADAGTSCAAVRTSPADHLATGRAVPGGWFNLLARSNGDLQDIGLAWNFWSRVTLHEGAPGRWFVRLPAGCAR